VWAGTAQAASARCVVRCSPWRYHALALGDAEGVVTSAHERPSAPSGRTTKRRSEHGRANPPIEEISTEPISAEVPVSGAP
jgi:hypothetical protein